MNSESYLTLLVAVCCIAAAGASAATLDSTLSTNPDEVIQLEYSKLPIGTDDAESIDREVKSNKGSGSQGSGGENAGEGTPSQPSDSEPGGSEQDSTADQNDEQQGSSGASGTEGDSGGGGGEGDGSGGSGGGANAGAGTPGSSFDWLGPLLVVLGALVVLLLAYRYRRRLLAVAAGLWGLLAGSDRSERDAATTRWPPGEPANEIRRAWLRMVEQLDVDRPHARTSVECAEAAMDSDLDPDAVRTLTEVFQEVRYGGAPVTDDRIDRARRSVRALGTGRGGGGAT